MTSADDSTRPAFGAALRFWLQLGLISFGGPSGQIAILHEALVVRRRWIDESSFLHALNFCMLLPGPEAQQLATYIGWRLHGVRGGVAAGVLFVLPSVFVLLALSWVYCAYGELRYVAAFFDGLQPAVVALVVAALVRIGSRALRGKLGWALASASLVASLALHAPFPVLVALAAAVGLVAAPRAANSDEMERFDASSVARVRVARLALTCATLWFAPPLAAALVLGRDDLLVEQGSFFSKASVVTFGGAYAVLPYVAQQAVEVHAWLEPHQMLDGLALAESTPGPLIMVLQFVGFVAGWREPRGFEPWQSGVLSALMTTWVTFAPCFLWVLVGAPFVERLRRSQRLAGALAGVTAAVVGVMASFAFGLAREVFTPAGVAGERTADLGALIVALLALGALATRRVPVVAVLGAAACAGLALD